MNPTPRRHRAGLPPRALRRAAARLSGEPFQPILNPPPLPRDRRVRRAPREAPRARSATLRHPLWGHWSTPLGRLTPAAFGRTPASEARRERKRAERAANPRITRRQRLALMRTGDPGATREDVTRVLRSAAYARRKGLL